MSTTNSSFSPKGWRSRYAYNIFTDAKPHFHLPVAPLCEERHAEGVGEHFEDFQALLAEPGLFPHLLAK